MKQKLLKTMLLLCALVVGSGSAWGQDYTYTLASGDFTTTTHSKTSGTITWTHAHGAGTESYAWDETYGFKFGSGNSSYPTSFTLTSSSITNKIKKVVVTANVNSKKSCNLDVKVGSTTYGSQATINTKKHDTWEFSIADASAVNGAVQLSFSSNSGPLYLERIDVYYYVSGVSSLSVKTAPTKVRYEVGESLDMSGFVLNADGEDVTTGYTMTMGGAAISNGATLSSAGKKTITVAYGGKEVSQNISVGAVQSIAVTTPPTKTSYDTGDSFDPTGMVVTASLSTGELSDPDTWTKAVTGYTVDPEDDLAPANKSVTITYSGQTTTQTITVTNVAVKGVSVKASTIIEKTKTETLTPTFTPTNATNKSVSWESDDTDVATVTAAGVVTGVSAGTAHITVTTADGGFTATCEVTVVNEKGSIDAPYSVADINNGGVSGSKYVQGYIVGCFAGKDKDAASSGNTNIALSDSKDEISGENTIAVQLPNGSIRTAWNIDDNAVIGAKVIVYGSVESYFTGKTGVKSTSSITAISASASVTSVGYATFTSKLPLDFTDSDIEAYIATTKGDGSGVNFTRKYKIPTNTGVLLHYPGVGAAEEDIPVLDGDANDVTGNVFVQGTGATVATDDGTNYNYILNNGASGLGFYRANDKMVATNRAYISILKSESASVKGFIALPGSEETAVEAVKADAENGVIFNLAGQRVSKLQRGINIINGKKVVVK